MLSFSAHLHNSGKHDSHVIALFMPSWLSGLIGVVGSLAIVLGAIGMAYYRNSSLKELVDTQQQTNASSGYEAVTTVMNTHPIISNIPLFVFWAGVGLIAYVFTMAIFNAFRSVADISEEMGYVHVQRTALITYAVERLLLRSGAFIIWFLYLKYTLQVLVPFTIAYGYAGTLNTYWLQGGLHILGAIAILIISSHAHAVLLRLIVLRPRLFTD